MRCRRISRGVAKSMEASQRNQSCRKVDRRRREISRAVAECLEALQRLWRCRISPGSVANSRETSQIRERRRRVPGRCREMTGGVANAAEMSRILRRRCKFSVDVANFGGAVTKSVDLSQIFWSLRQIGRRRSASGAARRVDVECRDRIESGRLRSARLPRSGTGLRQRDRSAEWPSQRRRG